MIVQLLKWKESRAAAVVVAEEEEESRAPETLAAEAVDRRLVDHQV